MSVNKYNTETGELELIAGGTLYADAPVGAIQAYGGATAPSGWLLCQGQAVSRATYAELFAVIGTAFGVGDGSTTFNVPDLREATTKGVGLSGKSSIHYDNDGIALGEFVDDRIKSHAHNVYVRDTGHYHGTDSGNNLPSPNNLNITKNSSGIGYVANPAPATANNTQPVSANIQVNSSPNFNGEANITADTGSRTNEVKAVGVNYIIKAKQVAVPADFKDAVDEAVEEALDGIGTVYTRQISVQAIEGGDWHVLDSVSVSGLPNGNYLVCLKVTPNVISQNFTSIIQIDGRGIGHSMAGGSYPYLSDSIIYTKSNDNAIGVSVYIPANSSLDAGTIYFDFVRLS